jgi:hypothetical protein
MRPAGGAAAGLDAPATTSRGCPLQRRDRRVVGRLSRFAAAPVAKPTSDHRDACSGVAGGHHDSRRPPREPRPASVSPQPPGLGGGMAPLLLKRRIAVRLAARTRFRCPPQ